MTIPWRATDLSVSPPSIQLADTDRRALSFDAGEPIAGASAAMVNLGTLGDEPSLIESVSSEGDAAVVTVSGFTRGATYELAVTFTRSDATAWTRTLVILCVA